MKVTLKRIGNSQGVVLPKPLLKQLGVADDELEMTIENDAIVIRKPKKHPRDGWREAAIAAVAAGEDGLVYEDFPNEIDSEIEW